MCQNGGTGWKIAGVACREELAERFEGGTVMKDSTVSVREEAVKLNPQLVKWRRHLHAHPKLRFETADTAAFVVARQRDRKSVV